MTLEAVYKSEFIFAKQVELNSDLQTEESSPAPGHIDMGAVPGGVGGDNMKLFPPI